MSRSIHKTIKGVFGGKTKKEVDLMFDEDDPDVLDIKKKWNYKADEIEKRKIKKTIQNIQKHDQ